MSHKFEDVWSNIERGGYCVVWGGCVALVDVVVLYDYLICFMSFWLCVCI